MAQRNGSKIAYPIVIPIDPLTDGDSLYIDIWSHLSGGGILRLGRFGVARFFDGDKPEYILAMLVSSQNGVEDYKTLRSTHSFILLCRWLEEKAPLDEWGMV